MKKGLLQRASKNWEEIKLVNDPIDIKEEESDSHNDHDLRKSILLSQSESSKMMTYNNKSDNETVKQQPHQQRKVQSMISVRKDYSYKYTKTPSLTLQEKEKYYNCLDISLKSSDQQQQSAINTKRELINNASTKLPKKPLILAHPKGAKPKEIVKRSHKPNISILERHDYDKGPKVIKLEKLDDDDDDEINSLSGAIIDVNKTNSSPQENLKILNVPIERPDIKEEKRKSIDYCERDKLKIILAQDEIEAPANVVKHEHDETAAATATTTLRQPTLSTESKDSQNINKINNKINIIFQLNDNSKSLRKNIILHRRTPKKMVQKITIKETNNNSTKSQSDENTSVPENKILCTIETQTEDVVSKCDMNMSLTNPLTDEITEHLFFENDIMISLQCNTISFFEYLKLSSLLKKGETDFRKIDRISRRLQDIQVDSDNKFQRLCYNDLNSLPIYVEMRAKQKPLEDPDMCPIAFLYCNIYYIDQNRAKFSSVHLDTVKSNIQDIRYTTVPNSSYFIMAWHEKPLDTKSNISGIVKYKLTPNLDLARLASIRQFPKLDYRIKQMYCGKDSQLITIGDTQVSIFNYDTGDLLVSLDLMKNYGVNLTSFTFDGGYLFLVYLADVDEDSSMRRLIIVGVHKHENNGFKVIHSIPVKVGRYEKIVSRSITSTNHLIVTFSSGSSLLVFLDNFQNFHFRTPSNGGSTLIAANDYMMFTSIDNINNVALSHFTEFFLNI